MSNYRKPPPRRPVAQRYEPRDYLAWLKAARRWLGGLSGSTLVLVILTAALAAALFMVVAFLAYLELSANPDNGIQSEPIRITATPPSASAPTLPPNANPARTGFITYDPTGTYAFPIAADPALYTWTHYHWDGTNAIDIEARLDLSRVEFASATAVALVAVTNGIVRNYSGNVGGLGYMLQADDGLDYYYAHMSEQWVPDGARVTTGQQLGRMGNTGGTARFIEPHLHLSIGTRDTLWDQQPNINAAEWLQQRFGLPWEDRPAVTVPYSEPGGWPVIHPQFVVTVPFNRSLESGLPQRSIELGFIGAPPNIAQNVLATIDGVVNVIRWTEPFGTRIQITNEAANYTVVISGVDSWLVTDGEAVSRGQIIATWNPANRARLNYMIFQASTPIDPEPTLG